MFWRKAKPKKPTFSRALTREQAMRAKPVAVEVVRRVDLPNNGVRIFVWGTPGKIARAVLRLPERVERKVDLDAFGIEIFDSCDGQKPVKYIIRQFAKKYDIDMGEAEKAVTRFIQLMIERGLAYVVVPKD